MQAEKVQGSGGKKRQRWNEQEARRVLEACRESGLSLGEFAAREGMKAGRLSRWQRRLAIGRGPEAGSGRRGKKAGGIRLIPAVAVAAPRSGAVAVHLPGGVMVEVETSGVPVQWIVTLVASLRGGTP